MQIFAGGSRDLESCSHHLSFRGAAKSMIIVSSTKGKVTPARHGTMRHGRSLSSAIDSNHEKVQKNFFVMSIRRIYRVCLIRTGHSIWTYGSAERTQQVQFARRFELAKRCCHITWRNLLPRLGRNVNETGEGERERGKKQNLRPSSIRISTHRDLLVLLLIDRSRKIGKRGK